MTVDYGCARCGAAVIDGYCDSCNDRTYAAPGSCSRQEPGRHRLSADLSSYGPDDSGLHNPYDPPGSYGEEPAGRKDLYGSPGSDPYGPAGPYRSADSYGSDAYGTAGSYTAEPYETDAYSREDSFQSEPYSADSYDLTPSYDLDGSDDPNGALDPNGSREYRGYPDLPNLDEPVRAKVRRKARRNQGSVRADIAGRVMTGVIAGCVVAAAALAWVAFAEDDMPPASADNLPTPAGAARPPVEAFPYASPVTPAPGLSSTRPQVKVAGQSPAPQPSESATRPSGSAPTRSTPSGQAPTSTPPPVPPTPRASPTRSPIPQETNTYEAESANNTMTSSASPGILIGNCTACSGGKKIRYLGTGNTLTFNGVTSPVTATAVVKIVFLNGDTVPRTATMSVNGGTPTSLSFDTTGGWNSTNVMTLTVRLVAGSNTLLFANPPGWSVDLDIITVVTGDQVG